MIGRKAGVCYHRDNMCHEVPSLIPALICFCFLLGWYFYGIGLYTDETTFKVEHALNHNHII